MIIQSAFYLSDTPFLFSYTSSSSMEPTIPVGDLYIFTPQFLVNSINVGDIILFRSGYSNQILCHRIVGTTGEEYITRGDNSPFTDQQGGMPAVNSEQIIGKVLTVKDDPLLIPKIGTIAMTLQALVNGNVILITLAFAAIGITLFLSEKKHYAKKRKIMHHKLRVKHVFLLFLSLLIFSSLLLMLYKSGDIPINYLSSQNSETTRQDIIGAGKTFERTLTVNNTGLIPLYLYVKPNSNEIKLESDNLELFMPGEGAEIKFEILASEEIGWHKESIGTFLYVALLPTEIITNVATINPYLPIVLTLLVLALPFIFAFVLFCDSNTVIKLNLTKELKKIGALFKI